MRIRILFEHLPNVRLPVNYQHIISAWIYNTLYQSDSKFGNWLHENGFEFNGKKYKHFCFSFLQPQRFRIENDDFFLQENPTELTLSFQILEGGKKWVSQIFNDTLFRIESGAYRAVLQIRELFVLSEPDFRETMIFRAKTPIALSIGEEGSSLPQFIDPDHERYKEVFTQNLAHKANAFFGEDKYAPENISLTILTKNPKLKGLGIGKSKVKGYLYDFEITAQPELLRIGYYGGFGIQNARLGMGYCEVKKKK